VFSFTKAGHNISLEDLLGGGGVEEDSRIFPQKGYTPNHVATQAHNYPGGLCVKIHTATKKKPEVRNLLPPKKGETSEP
jgi:hypothetical protein